MAGSRLAGKRAMVTGAASGIGRASALALAAEGADVMVTDIDPAVEAVADEITALGRRAVSAVLDVASAPQVEAQVARCVAELGGLEVMFANAGIVGGLGRILDSDEAVWERVFRVNLFGAVSCLKFAARHMREAGGGSIICTASVAGLRAGAGPAHYSASKAAIVNLVQTAAQQLTGTGVRTNAICPGLIETGMTRPVFAAARAAGKEDRIGQLNPSQRAGEAVEIAQAVVFLASDESSYINGHALVVDGGLSSSHPFVPGKLW